eukprot:CAMPEP_0176248994 /NCGR_PEP_ID=MMETSP0121_2-20121125/33751_1 /TAXON_ID=160619 /ORGANISM="Kryptoperidinium foliaceum, Strain CCMP 1326" /LENGTH=270 /DNA_ID=CAMNT_0017588685 /DNA_START=58 /DNA_END=870 /DNA_ORIENTATION=+
MAPALLAVALALLSSRCGAVRRQAAGLAPEGVRVHISSKSVASLPGADGRLHTLTRETETSRWGAGPAARVATVVTECKDGRCEERRVIDGSRADVHLPGHDWLQELFQQEDLDALMEPPPALSFGLDELEGLVGHSSWIDGNPFSSEFAMPTVESVTRTLQVTEHDGKQERQEFVWECKDGMCTMVFADDDEEAAAPAAADAGLHIVGLDTPAPGGAAKLSGSIARRVEKSAAGAFEEVLVVEQCRNGECTREIRRSGHGAQAHGAAHA